jgi:hypothetical protein
MKPDSAQINQSRVGLAAALTLLGILAIVNLAAFPFGKSTLGNQFPGVVLLAMGFGLLAAQAASLSTVLVWSNGPFVIRLVAVWAIGLFLYVCWLIGLLLSVDGPKAQEIALGRGLMLLASLPLTSLAVQLPHWAIRAYLGWKVQAGDAAELSETVGRFSIRDMLIATTLVALTVVATRFTAEEPSRLADVEFWLGWTITMAVFSALSLFFLVPLLVLVLKPMRIGLIFAFLLLAPLVGAFVSMAFIVTSEELALVYAGGVSCLASCSVPLWIGRLAGYRLVIGRR